jgi:hypothetical protein
MLKHAFMYWRPRPATSRALWNAKMPDPRVGAQTTEHRQGAGDRDRILDVQMLA